MKSETIKQFPKNLPNDLEWLMLYYPMKFPPVMAYFEEMAKKFFDKPQEYKQYAYWAQEEMFAGFELIKNRYDNEKNKSLEFLVDIDQQLGKMFCYRFWVVNYLFADGIWHEYFVENLKNLNRKVIDIEDDIEKYEQKVLSAERDLLQTDYADIYLQQAISSVEAVDLLLNDKQVGGLFKQTMENFEKLSEKEINSAWERIGNHIMEIRKKITKIENSNKSAGHNMDICNAFILPINQVEMRRSMKPLFAYLTHMVEFFAENKDLKIRHQQMKQRIKDYFKTAELKLSKKDFAFFKLCYEQSRNLSMSKDIMGEIDQFMLPFWFDEIHEQIKIMLKDNGCDPNYIIGHGGMFYYLVWFLPNDLKAKVMTPDNTSYELKGNKDEILKSSKAWNEWEHYREK